MGSLGLVYTLREHRDDALDVDLGWIGRTPQRRPKPIQGVAQGDTIPGDVDVKSSPCDRIPMSMGSSHQVGSPPMGPCGVMATDGCIESAPDEYGVCSRNETVELTEGVQDHHARLGELCERASAPRLMRPPLGHKRLRQVEVTGSDQQQRSGFSDPVPCGAKVGYILSSQARCDHAILGQLERGRWWHAERLQSARLCCVDPLYIGHQALKYWSNPLPTSPTRAPTTSDNSHGYSPTSGGHKPSRP